MGKNKVLVKVHPEGKFVVDLDKSIDIAQARARGGGGAAPLPQPGRCCVSSQSSWSVRVRIS
jgi:hypothetical protein